MGQEIRDKQGRTLGHFLNNDEFQTLMLAYLAREVTPEETEEAKRLVASGDRSQFKSSAQIREMLARLANESAG